MKSFYYLLTALMVGAITPHAYSQVYQPHSLKDTVINYYLRQLTGPAAIDYVQAVKNLPQDLQNILTHRLKEKLTKQLFSLFASQEEISLDDWVLENIIESIAFNYTGSRAIVGTHIQGGPGGKIFLADLTKDKYRRTEIAAPGSPVTKVAISGDGQVALTVLNQLNSTQLWRIQKLTPLPSITLGNFPHLTGMALNSDGKRAVLASSARAELYDTSPGIQPHMIRALDFDHRSGSVSSIALNSTGTLLAVGSKTCTSQTVCCAHVYDISGPKTEAIKLPINPAEQVTSVTFYTDTLVAVTTSKHTVLCDITDRASIIAREVPVVASFNSINTPNYDRRATLSCLSGNGFVLMHASSTFNIKRDLLTIQRLLIPDFTLDQLTFIGQLEGLKGQHVYPLVLLDDPVYKAIFSTFDKKYQRLIKNHYQSFLTRLCTIQ